MLFNNDEVFGNFMYAEDPECGCFVITLSKFYFPVVSLID